jgi:glycopeptide antibiotics resistance protein
LIRYDRLNTCLERAETMCKAPTTTTQPTIADRRALLRMAPLAALLALILFPFEWLGAQWPAFGHALDHAFATEAEHTIGHAALFAIFGLLALTLFPALRWRAWGYFRILFLAGLGQEGLQLAFKRRGLAYDDAHDLLVDLLGLTLAFVLVRLWQRGSSAEDRG